MLRELDQAREWMEALGRKTASERVAVFLLTIARKIDLNPDCGALGTGFDSHCRAARSLTCSD